jgi:DNA-binding response OmpR family regulator
MSPAPAPLQMQPAAAPTLQSVRACLTEEPAVSPATAVMVAETDPDIGRWIANQLVADGYEVLLARSLQHARALAQMRCPSLGIFGDLGGSRASLQLLEEIRSSPPVVATLPAPRPSSPWHPDMPVIMLVSATRELDLLRAFEAGADDLLLRPPRYLELRVRMQALLRRAWLGTPARLRTADLAIDLNTRDARLCGQRLELTRMEYELLAHLAAEPSRVHSKQELLRSIWGYKSACTTRTLDSHASRLRQKLARIDGQRWIVNVRAVGYRLL